MITKWPYENMGKVFLGKTLIDPLQPNCLSWEFITSMLYVVPVCSKGYLACKGLLSSLENNVICFLAALSEPPKVFDFQQTENIF